ncbi:hypothetical protein [Luteolibacter soli]|uniref:hypothetical protein n=1 Tax=Luteolibacter soli TaxID=3135280 RepID=UPI003119FEDC
MAAIGLAVLLRGVSKSVVALWLLVTVGSTVAIGMLEARLQVASGEIRIEKRSAAAWQFSLIQVFVLVPVLIFLLVLFLLGPGGIKISC